MVQTIDPTARVSPYARIHTDRLVIGAYSRIDDGAILTGDIEIGHHVHIGANVLLTGRYGIKIGDYSGLSPFVLLLTGSDDFSGRSMINPTVPDEYKPFLKTGPVAVGRSSMVGAHSTIMPGVIIGDGVAVGAYSLVNKNCIDNSLYAGRPAKRLKERCKDVWELISRFEA